MRRWKVKLTLKLTLSGSDPMSASAQKRTLVGLLSYVNRQESGFGGSDTRQLWSTNVRFPRRWRTRGGGQTFKRDGMDQNGF